MSVSSYEKKANIIIKNAIKSVVFVDEKAAEIFEKPDDSISENLLSVDLYKELRN